MNLRTVALFPVLTLFLAGCHSEPKGWEGQHWTSGKNLTKIMDKKGVAELSGLHWNPSDNRLYAVQDDGSLRILQYDPSTQHFSQIALLNSLDGPEGVTQVDERENSFYIIDENTCEIRKYTHQTDFTALTLANSWDLSLEPSGMTTKNNEGPEGIEFVPDRYLKAIGFVSSETRQPYLSVKGMHGLMFVAHQKKGMIWVYDLNPTQKNDFVMVGKYETGENESCDLSFDRSTGLMYILHNIGSNSVEVVNLKTQESKGKYRFIPVAEFDVPNPKGSRNIEGLAVAPKFGSQLPGSAWLCRDIAMDEKSHDRKDCLRWFKNFKAVGNRL